ncbi:ricin-type beta-trefoil lectin domain protein [Aeromicrobium sp.]|nr:ricin-type beta-trefoil lectin domain protein [Candidatus Saccharibacteria bacterium]
MKIKLPFKKLNQDGFDHVFLGVLTVVLIAVGGSYYVFTSRAAVAAQTIVNANGKCLNNQSNLKVEDNPIEEYHCMADAGAQKWTVKGSTIVNSNGYCLAAKSQLVSAPVVLKACNGKALQNWTVDAAARKIVSNPSGLCLDIPKNLQVDKTLMQIYTCNGTTAQDWKAVSGGVIATAPTISSFTANPASIANGNTTVLSWASTGNSCSVTPGGPIDTAAKTWTTGVLTATTSFTLSCRQDSGPVATKTAAVTVAAAPTAASGERFGMSAPAGTWDTRLKEVGGPAHIKYRRIFYTGFDSNFSLVQRAINDKMIPIISFKVTPYSWRQVADGSADASMKAMVAKLNAIPGEKFVALHHEPAKDGTAKDWADMQVHALPIIKAAGNNIKVGVIGNGWWWSNQANGYTDAEIAAYIPKSVIAVSDVIAADTYQNKVGSEGPGPKMKNMAAWAKRVGGVKALGVGEFNGEEAKAITEGMNAIKAEPMFAWACMWNNTAGIATVLTGDRLEAFKNGLLTNNPT